LSEDYKINRERLFDKIAEDLMQLKSLEPYPIMEVDAFNNSSVRLFVKVEHDNARGVDPARSIKRKPASMMGLFADELNPKRKIWISASSGNFALELGILANEMDKKIFAIIPPRTPRQRIKTLMSLGVNVVLVSEEEYDLCPREFTVFMVRALAKRYDNIVNIDQYNSVLNPLAHMLLTAREIDEKFGGDLTHIFVPLGSTGTFAGIYEYFSRFYPKIKIIGVQPTRMHRIPGVHNVIGDCKWSPEIFGLPDINATKILTIDDGPAYETLMELEIEYGIHGGPSTGMVFAAVKRELESGNISEGSSVLIISADSSWDYREWNMEILADLKGDLTEGGGEYLDKYMRILRRREDSESRVMKVKHLYKPKVEGELYTLEKFEEILTCI